MKSIFAFCCILLFNSQISFSENLELFTNDQIYAPSNPLFVYGTSLPNENIIIRLFHPDGTIAKFDQIEADSNGMFHHILLIWPETSTKFPYGVYDVEVTSTEQNGLSRIVSIRFSESTKTISIPIQHQINTSVFIPETIAVNNTTRIFSQITSDGMLISDDVNKLLGNSHVHLPSGEVVSFASKFRILHQGLYFADYTPEQVGTYVFHIVTFYNGLISHNSAITSVLIQDINGISNQIMKLDSILNETSDELSKLQHNTYNFGTSLDTANENINNSVSSITKSVNNIEKASIQLNSLFFPIVLFLTIIIALQITILARTRHV